MAYVHRETNWGARTGAPTCKDDDKPRKNGVTESNHLAHVNHSALRRLMNSTASIGARPTSSNRESPTLELVELVEAHGVTMVAVSADQELRAALTEVLPRNSIVFADSPEQALGRPVPDNCAVLIVEQSISRQAFEQLKSHHKVAAPALVNIMVGTQNDGSTLVGLLAKGWIDRFMVKPLVPGPTRIALRSALQQHHSLRSQVKINNANPDVPAAGSVPRVVRDVQVIASRSTHDRVMHNDKSEIFAVALEKIEQVSIHDVEELLNESPEVDLQIAPDAVIGPQHKSTVSAAATPRKLAPPSWKAVAAMIAVLALIAVIVVAWSMSTRATDVNANKVMVNKIVADHLAAAQRAFELGSYVDPPGLSATHFYNAALELDPTNEQAKQGLNAVTDRLIADGKQLIAAGDLLRAQSTLDSVRRMQPNQRELAAVTASLLSARETERLTIQASHAIAIVSPIEPIAVAASHNAVASPKVAAPQVVGRPSANIERKFDPRSQGRLLKVEPSVVSRSDSAIAGKSLGAIYLASAADLSSASLNGAPKLSDTQANQELLNSNSKRVDEGQIEPVQDEAALRAISKVAAMPAASERVASSTTGFGPDVATNVVDTKPKLLKYVPPVYPFRAREYGVEGWLDVSFMVTSDGNVINPRIENGTLDSRFHHAALAAVTQWKFSPAPNGATSNRPMKGRLEFRLTK